ncbi:MAG TPA: monofunctional biosynthetic peptidoglycan transglycosylase [Caulobacteraceae bacterium]|nr:monofunctional biosynthetic peptidoglycan transglycosylase [Caulobacteraceae bacterium]
MDQPEPQTPPPERPRRIQRPIRLLVIILLTIFVGVPLAGVLIHRFLPVPVTYLMVARLFEGESLNRRPVVLNRINPDLVYAVIAAEDARFCEHSGFDIKAIQKALKHNKRRPNRVRGASTISQQTAKNVFLWPGRGWVRKGLEAYYTVLIETIWPKRRIMEVYLNAVEWGPGVYGAEAAARKWFGKSARSLSANEAARLAAILPSPRKWKAASSGPYVRGRAGRIQAAMSVIRNEGLAACVIRR